MSQQKGFFLDSDFEDIELTPQPVTCLGKTFESDDARREYFRNELRSKLPELRKIEGFPIGEDDDIINLSDPPYYTACPNPWLNDFIAEWEKEKEQLKAEGKRDDNFEVKIPYAADVSEGKNNPIYMAHAYHTKVPHPAIMRYILHYTQPGDIVFDGFAGTGMTGVAAGKCESSDMGVGVSGLRHCICNDLSPIASFITHNFNNPIVQNSTEREIYRILDIVEKEYTHLYNTKHTNGKVGTISYVIWSEVFTCPQCGKEIVFYNEILDENNNIKDCIICPSCGVESGKSGMDKTFQSTTDVRGNVKNMPKIVPALIKYVYNGKKYTKIPDHDDLALLDVISHMETSENIPYYNIPEGVKTMELIRSGRTNVCDLYTRRNLLVFSALWRMSVNNPLLRFMMTSVLVKTGSLLHNVGIKNEKINLAGALPNALFIPSIIAERNVFELLRGKISDILKIEPEKLHHICNQIQSATDLSNIKDNSIDYIFTDPPFGSNLMYSELNFIHEAWLGLRTDNKEEAIENKSQHKDLFSYQNIMSNSFKEFFRILKPNRWMTVEFSNTSAAVWNSIQNALGRAGFTIAIVRGLDKKQGSFNAQTTTTAVKQDLVISCYKPSIILADKIRDGIPETTWDFIEEHLTYLPVHSLQDDKTTAIIERSPKILYDRLIAYYVQHGYAVPIDAIEFQKGLKDRFIERDGMYFTASQALEYEDKRAKSDGFVPMALFIASESDGIEWLKRKLETPKTYQELQPDWMKDLVAPKKGDVLPGLDVILEENFIKDVDGKWGKPDPENATHLEQLRGKRLMKEFNLYLEAAKKPKAKRMKDTRLEVLRYGFKDCYKQKNYQDIVTVGDHIQESLLMEDEILLQYYDIAVSRI